MDVNQYFTMNTSSCKYEELVKQVRAQTNHMKAQINHILRVAKRERWVYGRGKRR